MFVRHAYNYRVVPMMLVERGMRWNSHHRIMVVENSNHICMFCYIFLRSKFLYPNL